MGRSGDPNLTFFRPSTDPGDWTLSVCSILVGPRGCPPYLPQAFRHLLAGPGSRRGLNWLYKFPVGLWASSTQAILWKHTSFFKAYKGAPASVAVASGFDSASWRYTADQAMQRGTEEFVSSDQTDAVICSVSISAWWHGCVLTPDEMPKQQNL